MGYNDAKETLDYMRKLQGTNKSEAQKTLEAMGAKFDKDGKIIKAIEGNTLDSNKSKDDNKKSEAENKTKDKGTTNSNPESTTNSNSVFQRYNIDPTTFSVSDLQKWAEEHNHTVDISFNSGTVDIKPKTDGGFLGIGAKSKATQQEEEDAKVLLALAYNTGNANIAQEDLGAAVSAGSGFMDGYTFGFFDKAADFGTKRQYEKAGLPEDLYVKPSQALDKTKENHPVANTVGTLTGVGVTLASPVGKGAITKGVSTAADWAKTYNNILKASKALGATKGAIRTAKLARALPTIMTMATPAILTYNRQQSKLSDADYEQLFKVQSEYSNNPMGKGNIDLTQRPIYQNEDGTISTVSSMTITEDGKAILIPTIVYGPDGVPTRLTEDEAIEYYHKTGEHLGMFDSIKDADEYAKKLSKEQGIYYSNMLDDKKDLPLEWLEKQIATGNAQYAKGLAASLDFILPTEVMGKYDLISKVNDYYGDTLYSNSLEAQQSSSNLGKGWETAGEAVQVVTAALPNSITALFLAGANVPAQATQFSKNATINATANFLKQTANNPQYWTSLLQTIGTDYEDAKKNGASETVASVSAIISSAINAGIELGGIQGLPDKLVKQLSGDVSKRTVRNLIVQWATSMLEEGYEEVLQGIVTNLTAKMLYNHNAPILSTTDENAVINPVKALKEFSLGAVAGGFLGGGQIAAIETINRGNISRVGNYMQQFKDEVIAIGLSSPQDTESYKLAQKLSKKSGKVSDYNLGKLHLANLDQLEVKVGDTFIENGTGREIKIVNRDENATELEITLNGKTETVLRTNETADTLAVDDKYNKVGTTATETTPTEQSSVTENPVVAEATQQTDGASTVYNMLVGEKLTNKVIDNIISTPELRDAFEQLTGVKIKGTKAEQRVVVRNTAENLKSQATTEAVAENATTTETVTPQTTPSVKVGDVYEAGGKTYTITGRDNGRTTYTITDEKGNTVIREISNVTADINFTKEDAYTKVQDGNALTTETKNVPATDESGSANKVTPHTKEKANVAEISLVVDAMNETLRVGALNAIYESMPPKFEKSLDIFADLLIGFYKQHHTIGHMAEYFTDGGAKVIAAIESTLSKSNLDNRVDNKTVVETTQNTENVLKNQSESATIEEKTTTKTVPDADKSHTVAYTNDNQRIDLRYKVVSVDDLVVSNSLDGKVNPDYPQELQPRDRSRTSSQSQIRQMAANLNSARLAESTSVSEGSPIVGPDNVVESGNGRTLAIELAYKNGYADEYRNYIIRNADKYGLDISNLPERPVLVRERLNEVDRIEFTRKANESSIGSLSATEQAKVDAEKLTEDVLNLLVANDDGIINTSDNHNFISAVITKVFKNEDLNNVVGADGRLSARGLERITNAIFYKAYGDASLSARLSESLDNDMKNATKVLLNIAPRIVSIKNGISSGIMYDFDFSTDIVSAIKLFEKCRNQSTTLENYAAQESLFEKEPELTLAMAYVFETKNRGAKQATDFYNLLLDTVTELGNPNQISLDIVDIFKTKEEVFDATVKKFNNRVERKNAITISENIFRPESKIGRENDRRGIDEVSGNEPNQNEKTGNAVGVQHDSRRSKETGVVANDEQLRQTNESVERQSKIEREENGNERRSNSVSENSRWGNNGSTRKQAGRISYFERKNQGRNATERKNFARELIRRGQAEEVIKRIGKYTYKYTLVKSEAYNDDMLSMVEEAKKKGVELGFFIGNAKVNFDTKDAFLIDGIKISDSQILVQYDEDLSPQKLFKHELGHAKWKTSEWQRLKHTILDGISETDKKNILSQYRYKRYMEIYKNEAIVLEEFVCDVMSGMNEYTANYIDVVTDYWYGSEAIDSYSPADYTTSTDAGGENTERYSFAGEKADTADLSKLDETKKMLEQGLAKEYILKQTGWFKGADGKWRFEIDDSNSKFFFENLKQETTLENVWKNDAVYKAYPFLKNITIKAKNFGNESRKYGEYNALTNTIFISDEIFDVDTTEYSQNKYEQTIIHEVQHAIQVYEGFELGGTSDEMIGYLRLKAHEYLANATDDKLQQILASGSIAELNKYVDDFIVNQFGAKDIKDASEKAYFLLHGEKEARAAGERMLLTSEERKEKYPHYGKGAILRDDIEGKNINDRVSATSERIPESKFISYLYSDSRRGMGEMERLGEELRASRISETKDQEYLKAVESGDVETASKLIEETAERVFSNSKVRGSDGKLRLVYHGTVNDFTVFKREFANIEGDFGKGYYFTSNEYDVDANYANEEGPDLKNKIAHLAERLEWEDEYADLSYEEREEIARQRLVTSEPTTITAYLNMENPVYITPDEKGTFLDYNANYDEENDEYGEPEGLLLDFIEALQNNSYDYAYNDVDFSFLYEYAYDGGMYASDAVKIIKERILDELTDEAGDIATNEVIRLAFEEIGFDGIIDTSVYYKFRNMDGMDSGTTHYIVFNENQIKSADIATYDDNGNVIPLSERFNAENNDIRFSLKDEINSLPAEDKEIVLEARNRAVYSKSIATMSESRLSKIYSDYSDSNPSTTNGYLAYIEPYDFLSLTTTSTEAFLKRNPQRLNEGVSVWGNENNIQNSGALYLRIDEQGNVVGHEGRHRMAGLLREGVNRVAVVIQTSRVDNAKPISIKKLSGQDFGNVKSYSSVYVHNMLPISKEYENINKHIFGDVTEGNKFVEPNIRYSIAKDSYAPTFYSQMGKTIDEMKQEKIGANSVVSYLKGRGVKDEEIKWSGIETFLDGKKSVTKAELQEFVANSQLQIEETVLSDGEAITIKQSSYEPNDLVVMHGGTVHDTLSWDEKEKVWVSDASGYYFTSKENIRNYYKVNDNGTRWGDYKLDGGENYREIIFKMPNSDYSNQSMRTHWGEDAKGILAHARLQDFDVDGKKMLFIEEIQSDWHNEGAKKGYAKSNDADIRAKRQELENYIKSRLGKENSAEEIAKLQEARREYIRLGQNMSNADAIPDAPFRNNYHEYVLKNIIRMAAEQGYDSIGWTTADIQSKRWSEDYAEAYRIEYDQDIPKFLNKYGKKWGAKVGKTEIGKVDGGWYEVEGTEVWSMDITDSMKESVLYEGQARYSLATDGIPDLEDLWEYAKTKYGTIPKGEIPARDVDVPKKISKKDVVSRFARTMIEAGVTPDETVSEFEKAILDGTMTHEVITNKNASERAKQLIKHLGFEDALKQWSVLSEAGKIGKNELALGMELYNQCITNKDVRNAMKLAAELVAEATRAGQTLQATRMLKRMTPDGQLYYLEKSIQKMNEEFKEKLGDKYKDIELDEELMEEFLTERDEKKRNEIYDKICQNIADQIPATKLDKWNSWRYLAMLGNLRTHLRNIFGNAVFIPSLKLKNYIGAVAEKAAKVNTSNRTKSLRKSKEAVEFAKKDVEEMIKVLQGENAKYAVTSDIQGKRTIFKTRWLEKLRLKNFDFLEREDMWFLKYHYTDALARLITARNIDVNSITPQMLEQLRAYAVKEAQAATYRDANALAEGLNRLQKNLEHSDKKAIRASGILLEGVMPFKKTPLNIAKQGINYSPIGVLKGVYNALTKLKTGDTTITDVLDDLSKGLSGTMVMLLGYFLASMGWLGGDEDKSKKEKEFDKMVGEQSYALNIGDIFSYTIDWMTPSNLSLFIGAKLHDLTKDDFEFADVVGALSTVTEPLLELSVFSGLNGVIESAQYSDSEALLAIGSDMITSYLMQGLPTIGGQISRIVDGSKREYYYTDKNSVLPQGLQRLIGQASSKIPFASYLFQPAIDEWGREEKYGNIVERVLENTVSPGYYSAKNYTEVDKELKELHERTGDDSVLPVIQQKKYTEDSVNYYMRAEDYTETKKIRGQKSFELVSELLSNKKSVKVQNKKTKKYQNKRYSQMSDDEKVRAIQKCYEEAGDYTKEQMLEKIKSKSK